MPLQSVIGQPRAVYLLRRLWQVIFPNARRPECAHMRLRKGVAVGSGAGHYSAARLWTDDTTALLGTTNRRSLYGLLIACRAWNDGVNAVAHASCRVLAFTNGCGCEGWRHS